jgi:hypothetical protein
MRAATLGPYVRDMSESSRVSTLRWLAILLVATAAALLATWLAHLAGVQPRTLLSVAAGAVALAWLIVLLAVPWNLYFAARRVSAQMATSAERGILVKDADRAEASRIARRMLWFALGGHLLSAGVIAILTAISGSRIGYYFAAFYLLSASFRPAAAYFAHLRARIGVLSRESLHPRDDVISLRQQMDRLTGLVKDLTAQLPQVQRALADDLRLTDTRLSDAITHTRQMLSADLIAIRAEQAADREATRSRAEDLGRRIDQIARRIESTLDGVSDTRELQAGLRALVRMIRTDAEG